MTEDEYIRSTLKRNAAKLSADKIQMRPQALIELLRDAFRAGEKRGAEFRPNNIFDEIFKGK